MQKEDKEYFGSILKQIKSKFNRCFWPDGSCTDKAINAHSIQNSVVLDLLCDDSNHIIMPQMELDLNTGPKFYFDKVGRNRATTFNGLCDKHDAQLFEPIDKYTFSPDDQEQLFLIAYRSVLRELHTKMKGAVDIQSQYMKGVDLGRFSTEGFDEPSAIATVNLMEAYMFYQYKFEFDQIYLNEDYCQIMHKIDFIENVKPTIAVSSVYSLIDNIKLPGDREDPKSIILNVFPYDTGLYMIFSFKKRQKQHFFSHVEMILHAERYYKLYLLSKLVLMHCENFVISPEVFNSFSVEKIELIKKFFMENIYAEKKDDDNKDLYLFHSEC